MLITTHHITLNTKPGGTIQDLTSQVKELVAKAAFNQGYALIFTKHTTTAIKINENEERLLKDLLVHLERHAPLKRGYLHDDLHLRDCPPEERPNGHAHLKAMALNCSEFIPIVNGSLALGKWQSILFLDLDGGRQREIVVQIAGAR